ncbi:MAG: hypothetical protein DRO92_00385 [Candidatus Altiarchaeales archaeon]|nr:MAG: hypothetical protein DRO92_00380 [Candidatus Altiarchaeales archaeon]RLI96048.1 MAG: hypothetical protein DRO92_00385 [Candidatus Altiarchaeales archaeon]
MVFFSKNPVDEPIIPAANDVEITLPTPNAETTRNANKGSEDNAPIPQIPKISSENSKEHGILNINPRAIAPMWRTLKFKLNNGFAKLINLDAIR